MFFIPANSRVSIARTDDPDRRWRAHTTRIDLRFEKEVRTSEVFGTSGAVIFERDGFYILTRRNKVK